MQLTKTQDGPLFSLSYIFLSSNSTIYMKTPSGSELNNIYMK